MKRYNESIYYYNETIKLDVKYIEAYNGLGIVYLNLKNSEKAIECYLKGIKVDEKYVKIYYNLGLAYENVKEYEKAIEAFKEYLELDKPNELEFFIENAKSKIEELEKKLESQPYELISGLIDEIKNILLFKEACLTHYTTLSTARALILESSSFRLSEGSFMNDTAEGKELFKFLIIDNNEISFSESGAILFAQKPYIGSFVDESKYDDLTLWRMYGKENNEEAKGCAITLRVEEFIEKVNDKLIPKDKKESGDVIEKEDYQFYHVAYCDLKAKKKFTVPSLGRKKESDLNKKMQKLSKAVSTFMEDDEIDKEDRKNVRELLNEIAFLFKSIDYQHEQEVRLVIKGIGFKKEVKELKSNEENGTTSPKVYIETVPIRELISKITLGPKVERGEEWAAAFYYSLKKDDLTPEILISNLPFK